MKRIMLVLISGAATGFMAGAAIVSTPFLPSLIPATVVQEECYYHGQPAGFWFHQLHDHDSSFRVMAIQALEEIGAREENVVPALAGMLKDRITAVRLTAAMALRKLGSAAAAAVPSLIQALEDEDPFVRANAAWALASIQPEDETVVAALLPKLDDESTIVRRAVFQIIREIGPRSSAALPALQEAVANQDPDLLNQAFGDRGDMN